MDRPGALHPYERDPHPKCALVPQTNDVFVTADGVTVGAMVGAAVLVAGHTRRSLRLGGRARAELERGGCVVLGVVVDQA